MNMTAGGEPEVLTINSADTIPEGTEITWYSFDSKVATVTPSADGKSCTVTPLKAGYTEITATIRYEGGTVAGCQVYVE